MKERPILFSAPMVRALLAGTKTQTRRLLRAQPRPMPALNPSPTMLGWPVNACTYRFSDTVPTAFVATCPYGIPGDRLWVKESWRVGKPHNDRSPTEVVARMRDDDSPLGPRGVTVLYEAGGWQSVCSVVRPEPDYPDDEPMPVWAGKRRASIHMPRAFSRITLEVTDVRVERLKEISAHDAWAEGIAYSPDVNPWHEYGELWESINGAGSWDANPWVWVVEFKRLP